MCCKTTGMLDLIDQIGLTDILILKDVFTNNQETQNVKVVGSPQYLFQLNSFIQITSIASQAGLVGGSSIATNKAVLLRPSVSIRPSGPLSHHCRLGQHDRHCRHERPSQPEPTVLMDHICCYGYQHLAGLGWPGQHDWLVLLAIKVLWILMV